MKKEKVRIGKIIRKTSGAKHAWYEATIGDFPIELKKPMNPEHQKTNYSN